MQKPVVDLNHSTAVIGSKCNYPEFGRSRSQSLPGILYTFNHPHNLNTIRNQSDVKADTKLAVCKTESAPENSTVVTKAPTRVFVHPSSKHNKVESE